MSSEAPAALWLALALPAILALWLLRPRRARHRVSSLLLWQGSEVERKSARPWQRLRNHPLLWLQLLVALLLVLAAVRPFLPAQVEAQHVVVLLDASGSMQATDVAPSRFAAAQQRVREVARSLGPDQRLTLIRLDEAPRVLATATAGEAEAIERAVAAQEAGYGAADLPAALALAEGTAPDAAEWLLVSDAVLDVPTGTRLPDGVSLRTDLVAAAGPTGNVAVSGLRVRADDERASVQAGVRNTGGKSVSGRLVLLAESEVVSAQEWTLAAGEERHVTWTELVSGPRWFEARLADVPEDANALAHDDRAWAGVPPREQRRVLFVSRGNTFLERALSVVAGVRADRVAPDAWAAVTAAEAPYDVVVMDGIWPDEPPLGNLLLVGQPSAQAFSPEELEPAAGHPLLRHVDWSDVSIAAAGPLPDAGTWEAVVRSSGGPLVAVRERGGRREAALAFDLEHSDLALRPAFPVLMANLLDWLAPHAAGEPLSAPPGAAVHIEAPPLAEAVHVEDPEGGRQELAPPWPPAAFRPPHPGLYRIVQAGPAGSHERLLISPGYVASQASLAPRALSIEGGDDGSGRGALPSAMSLWPLLALAVVAASFVEWWVDARGR